MYRFCSFVSLFIAGGGLLAGLGGGASPQLEGVKIKSLEEYEKRLYSPFDSEEEVCS